MDDMAHVHTSPRVQFVWKHGCVGMSTQRRQFPLRLAYTITFNKSRGKTLRRAVVAARNPAFVHGQLCVALSRVARTSMC